MKQIILLICLLLLITSTEVLSAKTELTKRLGQTIDQDERQYFNLFPKISGFVSAELISEGNDK